MVEVPPAARGIRRTNHVCSIKACYNLLAPHVPWKMCDTCRAHDRQVRRNKRLHNARKLESGDNVSESGEYYDGSGGAVIRNVAVQAIEKPALSSTEPHTSVLTPTVNSTSASSSQANSSQDVFTDLLLPDHRTSMEVRCLSCAICNSF